MAKPSRRAAPRRRAVRPGWTPSETAVALGVASLLAGLSASWLPGTTARGQLLGAFALAAGVPISGSNVEVPGLLWVAHILFWMAWVALLCGYLVRARRRRGRKGLRSGNPAVRAETQRKR